MTWFQKEITLSPRPRGFHLITRDIVAAVPEIALYSVGLAHLFIRHTSAALALNENADPTVRADMEAYFDRLAPENAAYYKHTIEGPDDMPAHLKAVLLGSSLTIPISNGRLALGTWQGVYLCEHRDDGGRRRVVVTLSGQVRTSEVPKDL
ncbi:MAG: secondary thiamine-phosphate synthase enzyme YjbQ [Anaerolineae bacterium]|uniref:secondary thiamine-phosphate synthase enzyme YjbQ n=1 Tax=Promineifilum sp. TaxID=2664178 RepID=UPI001DBEA985|nr:secondary thiamine-phosphate synthase enzyme YjbQ [Anaerolineales bacterium]MCB8933947.1 YjbQ family protein [Promineifilum sp.]MCO5179348.1 secondary thiamine-phosphate synthase enzyme YjbQ [Promineifilum sp.]MCW5845938.1 secondary thiamine-phosphate synthase enzyme YjbQ [Anaerolineae bacterium]